MELIIQDFLRTQIAGGYSVERTFEVLASDWGITATRHPEFPELVQFTYDQIESSKVKNHPMVCECRGLILNSDDDWSVVARPFNRFFNYGEIEAENNIFDFNGPMKVYEKVDGSLCIVYFYAGVWNVATKGSPSASGNVGDEKFTFADLFWTTTNKQFDFELSDGLMPGFTFLFELTSKFNRVVTNQINNDGMVTLLGVRNNADGYEYDINYFGRLNPVRSFPLNSVEEIQKAAELLDPSEQEGYVIVDRSFNRLKIKSPKYVMIHHLKDSLNTERMAALIQTGESSEVFVYFPDLKEKYDEMLVEYNYWAKNLDKKWNDFSVEFNNRKNPSRRDMAQHILATYFSRTTNFFFSMLDGKVKNGKDWLNKLHPKKLADLLAVGLI